MFDYFYSNVSNIGFLSCLKSKSTFFYEESRINEKAYIIDNANNDFII